MNITEHTDPFNPNKTFWVVNDIIEFHDNGWVYPALTHSNPTQSFGIEQLKLPNPIRAYYDIKHLFTPEELTILMMRFGPIKSKIPTLTDVVTYETLLQHRNQ